MSTSNQPMTNQDILCVLDIHIDLGTQLRLPVPRPVDYASQILTWMQNTALELWRVSDTMLPSGVLGQEFMDFWGTLLLVEPPEQLNACLDKLCQMRAYWHTAPPAPRASVLQTEQE